MDEHDPELKRRLESLADHTEPRGAGPVLEAARVRAAAGGPTGVRRNGLLLASVAACVALIAATATLVSQNASSSHRDAKAAGQTTTSRGDATSTEGTDSTTGAEGNDTTPTDGTGTTVATPAGGTTKPTTKGTATTKPGPSTTLAPDNPARVRLQSFASCPALVDYARAEGQKVVGAYGLPGGQVNAVAGTVNLAAPTASAKESAGSAPDSTPDFSTTNNQEAGVDEPDQVKTDGRRIFAVAGNKVWAASTEGAPKVVGSLAFEGMFPQHLLLAGDRLLVIGSSNGNPGDPQPAMMLSRAYVGQARIAVVDVKDASAMKVVSTLSIDGGYVNARMVKNVARVVVRSEPKGFDWVYPEDSTPEAERVATEKNRRLVAQSTTANWLPNVTVTDGAGKTSGSRALSDCNDTLRPAAFSGLGMLSVFTVDPARPDASNSTSVLAGGDIVYASTSALYVSTTEWQRVEKQSVSYGPDTMVHKFDISSPDGAQYRVSGRVKGVALNQYSFSELDGKLRVATTGSEPTSSESYVTVLDDDGKTLKVIGQVGGLGKGERIYAVRFIGKTGYVVTFRQTDPLYTIDLSDPTKPRVVGELKIVGYSAYLHPIADGLLMGVGQDATEQGRRLGTQVSVFDVSDLANPKLLHKQALGQGQSSAEFDPHAFLWWPATKLAVLPVTLFGNQGPTFTGAVGFTADAGQLTEVGRMQHPAQGQGNASRPAVVERSLVIGSTLFTMSQHGLLASDLGTLTDKAWVPFA